MTFFFNSDFVVSGKWHFFYRVASDGSMVVQLLAVSAHRSKDVVRFSAETFLYGVCMFTSCIQRFPPAASHSHTASLMLIGASKLPQGVQFTPGTWLVLKELFMQNQLFSNTQRWRFNPLANSSLSSCPRKQAGSRLAHTRRSLGDQAVLENELQK